MICRLLCFEWKCTTLTFVCHFLFWSQSERIGEGLHVVSSPPLPRQLVTFSPLDHFFPQEISGRPPPQSDTSMFFLLNMKGDYGWKSEGYWLSDLVSNDTLTTKTILSPKSRLDFLNINNSNCWLTFRFGKFFNNRCMLYERDGWD